MGAVVQAVRPLLLSPVDQQEAGSEVGQLGLGLEPVRDASAAGYYTATLDP